MLDFAFATSRWRQQAGTQRMVTLQQSETGQA
jgi:hypothetical protein